MRTMHKIRAFLFIFFIISPAGWSFAGMFGVPQAVQILNLPLDEQGIPISTEEPFESRDGLYLFFNTGQSQNNKDLHYAQRDSQGQWAYRGEIGPGINTRKEVEGNPTMDQNYQLYFINSATDPMIDHGRFNAQRGRMDDRQPLSGLPGKEVKLFQQTIHGNMGVEVSQDGNTLYFSRATWKLKGLKLGRIIAADILFANKSDGRFEYDAALVKRIMTNINTPDLEYAESITRDGLTIFFTRLDAGYFREGRLRSKIMMARRAGPGEPFGLPVMIESIGDQDFVEGPAISADGRYLLYHKLEGRKFRLFQIRIE